MTGEKGKINVYGARVHNLKNIDVCIPHDSLTVITGLSGSGKSSLAFDTIFAEGQRRYIETFSAYARNFLDNLDRPDVDKITGLSPVISIEQKTTNKNPRSTVGTVTEIYDYMRLLFARVGDAYSYVTNEKMVKYTEEKVAQLIINEYKEHSIYILSPIIKNRKGHYKELFEKLQHKGFLNVRIDGELSEIRRGMKLERYKNHSIEVVIDKLLVQEKDEERLNKSVLQALKQGEGILMILDKDKNDIRYYSKLLMCPTSGISYKDPAPQNFSFNSTAGACQHCRGLGAVDEIDIDKIIPNKKLSVHDGGIVPLGRYKNVLIFWEMSAILEKYGSDLKTPLSEVPDDALDEILHGSNDQLRIPSSVAKTSNDYFIDFDGLAKYIRRMAEVDDSAKLKRWVDQFSMTKVCPICKGQRLNQEALHFFIDGKNIFELCEMDISELFEWFQNVEKNLSSKQQKIAHEIIKEISSHLKFLLNVGLDYLCLNRTSASLSGGESQRIRLATQIGSQLVNVLYILDEPSIGLHQRDNRLLISSLKDLRDSGNTVVVVEHDKDMMLCSDYIIDMGPKAGRLGGEVVFEGTIKNMLKTKTLTANYLNGNIKFKLPSQRREGNGKYLLLKGAEGNNLKKIDVKFPLGKLICVTGVSGSGKSTLINGTLLPILSKYFYRSLREPLKYKSIEGIDNIDKVVSVDQSPIGRTPRSNPATYTGVFSDIRSLFVELPEAKIRGYKPGRFSFNVKGGRCETCKGNGYRKIEMNFLPDVFVPCEVCHGKRYNRETLEVRFKGKSIADILDMTINSAVEFFDNVPHILRKIKVLQDVGLGYIRLGQSSTTLSGGESQRIKLGAELSKKDTGKTLYILDEPTTGLHFEDIRVLISVLNRLVNKGNTVIVIEHNIDVIKMSDYIIDIGPDGGRRGGEILCTGTPEEIVSQRKGFTYKYIKEELESQK